MEEIKYFNDAWDGDLVTFKGKTYRVIKADITEAGHFKRLKVVNPNPVLPILFIKNIYG